MSKITMTIGAAVCAAVLGLGWAASAKADPAIMLAPAKGVSLAVGSKRAVGHFEPRDGKCNLTLMIAEASDVMADAKPSATRIRVAVEPGKAVSFDTAEGRSVAFACALGATAMTVKAFDQVAWARAERS